MGFLTINTSCSCEYLSATLIRNVCFRSLRLPGVLLSRITLKAGEVALQRWGQPWAERLLFVQGNPRQSQEGNPSMFTRGINYPSWRKKKKKRHTLFYAGKGFLKEAMQASCFWTSTRNHYRSTTPFDSNWSLVTACWKNRQRWDCTLYLDVQNAFFTIFLCFAVFNMGIISSS